MTIHKLRFVASANSRPNSWGARNKIWI